MRGRLWHSLNYTFWGHSNLATLPKWPHTQAAVFSQAEIKISRAQGGILSLGFSAELPLLIITIDSGWQKKSSFEEWGNYQFWSRFRSWMAPDHRRSANHSNRSEIFLAPLVCVRTHMCTHTNVVFRCSVFCYFLFIVEIGASPFPVTSGWLDKPAPAKKG